MLIEKNERALIGTVLQDNSAFYDVPFLSGDDFSDQRHKWIWRSISVILERRESATPLTVITELDKANTLAKAGGSEYVISLLEHASERRHAETYGKEIERKSVRRKLVIASKEIKKLALDEEKDVDTVLALAGQKLFSVSEGRRGQHGEPMTLHDAASMYYNAVVRSSEGDGFVGPVTGYKQLDALLGGFGDRDMHVLAARPGMGKTTLALNIAQAASRMPNADGPVVVFSLEMSTKQVVNRLVCSIGGMNATQVRRGRVDDWDKFNAAVARAATLNIIVDDTTSLTPAQLRSKCRRLREEYGDLWLIVIDYLQLMSTARAFSNRVQEITFISGSIVSISREMNTPVLAVAQLSRAVEQRRDRHPILSDLRESGSIEQDSATVMFLYRDDYYYPEETPKPNIAEVNLIKNRHGPTGTTELYFAKDIGRFKEVEYERFNR